MFVLLAAAAVVLFAFYKVRAFKMEASTAAPADPDGDGYLDVGGAPAGAATPTSPFKASARKMKSATLTANGASAARCSKCQAKQAFCIYNDVATRRRTMTLSSATNRRSRSSSIPAAEKQTMGSNDRTRPVFGQPGYNVNLGAAEAPGSGQSSADGPEPGAARLGGKVKYAYVSEELKTCKKTSVADSLFCDRQRCPGAKGACATAKSSGAAFCPEHTWCSIVTRLSRIHFYHFEGREHGRFV